MNKVKWWDEYEIKARYIPTFISVIPLVHFLILFLGKEFWNELIGNVSWMIVVANLGFSLIVMLALVQVQCSIGKHWIEESVFGKAGEKFPTTDMLLYREGLISLEKKELIRAKISELFNCSFSSKKEEEENPSIARLRAREAVGHVRSYVGKGNMTFQYNVRYGFVRNFIGGVAWGSVGSIGCAVTYWIEGSWRQMGMFICLAIIFLSLASFKKKILNKFAFSYADTLFSEFFQSERSVNNG